LRTLLLSSRGTSQGGVTDRLPGKVNRIANLGLRSLTLASRFLLLFLLARLLEPAEVGLYGLVAATIGYALFLVGFDFYIYTTREVIGHDRSHWGALLKNQCGLVVTLYLIFLPLLTLIFWFGLLPWYVAPWFFILLFLEHLNQELSRLLVALSRPLTASWVLFLRSGLWIIALAAIMLAQSQARTLLVVFQTWSLGGVMAALLGISSLIRMNIGGWRQDIDWKWIRRGLKVAIPFLLATLAIRGIFTADRYWFEALADIEVLAAYVLFMGIAGALGSFLEAGVYMFEYPALIRSWQDQSSATFRLDSRRLLIQTMLFSTVFIIVVSLALPFLLTWLDRPIYTQNAELFPYLMFSMVLFSLSMVPHYVLYAQGHDRAIIYSHIFGLVCFLLATPILSAWDASLAVPASLCVAFTVVLLWKTVAYMVLTPYKYRIFVPVN
jgi:O-antigen/teichoic acid export membrane protein